MVAHAYNSSSLNLLDYSEFQASLSYTVRSCQRREGDDGERDRDRKTERQRDKREEERKGSIAMHEPTEDPACPTLPFQLHTFISILLSLTPLQQ